MKIVVLAGGLSSERDVSLSSGSLVATALRKNGHQVMLIDLYLGLEAGAGRWTDKEEEEDAAQQRGGVPEQAPDLKELKKISGRGEKQIGPRVLEVCREADLVFVALHGAVGENGQLQAWLDLYQIPYTGTGYEGAMLAMNKDLAKQIMRANGVKTARGVAVGAGRKNWKEKVIRAGLKYPLVVKPVTGGSSVGVSLAKNEKELEAIKANLPKENQEEFLIEELIRGREFSIGILDGQALPVIEIIPEGEFYDYQNKYQVGKAREICPAEIDREWEIKLQTEAEKVHQFLKLGFYSRIDFIMTAEGEAYCLEANALPGMTPTSLVPQEAKVAGISYEELCEKIVRAGVERAKENASVSS